MKRAKDYGYDKMPRGELIEELLAWHEKFNARVAEEQEQFARDFSARWEPTVEKLHDALRKDFNHDDLLERAHEVLTVYCPDASKTPRRFLDNLSVTFRYFCRIKQQRKTARLLLKAASEILQAHERKGYMSWVDYEYVVKNLREHLKGE